MNLKNFIDIVKPYTMTSVERITELYNSLEYIRKNEINGDFVECGVWKGGNVLGIAEYLFFHKMDGRKIWLYDTFNGMTDPSDLDIDLNGSKARDILSSVFCYSSINEVKNNLSKTNYDKTNVKYIIGDVNKTLDIKENIPKKIALLRLDTDWYESTKKELEILYPILNENGVLIVDDYGHWKGAKLATDEYFLNKNVLLEKIDYTGIKIIKNNL